MMMKSVKLFLKFQKELKRRYKYTIFFSILVLFLIPFVPKLLSNQINTIFTECLSAINSVTASILAAALFAVAIEFSDIRKSLSKNIAFRNFFNIQDDERPYIILPRFTSPKDFSVNLEDRMWLSFNDIIALRHLSTMFAEHKAPAPRIIFDSDLREVLYGQIKDNVKDEKQRKRFDNITKAKSFFSIGLFSNEVSKEIISMSQEFDGYFSKHEISPCLFSYDINATKNERTYLSIPSLNEKDLYQWHNRVKNRNPNNFEHKIIEKESTLTLLSRFNLLNDKTIFIVGGIENRGTRKMASYLRENWRMIRDVKKPERKKEIGNNPFSMIFRQDLKPQTKPLRIATYYRNNE